MLSIEILHNKDCRAWLTLREELKRWLRMWGLNGTIRPKVTAVETEDEARRRRFFGSPQLLVNGKDVDPMAEKVTNYHAQGCRMYVWSGDVYEYPPKEMVERAIMELGKTWKPVKKEKSK